MPRVEAGLRLHTRFDAETQTQWMADDGLLGKPLVYVSPNGGCYRTVVDCYALRSVHQPHRLRSCSFCCCANPVLSSGRR